MNNIWRDFHPSADTLLVAVALMGLGVLATLLVFFEPHPTAKDIMLVIIGSLATFLTRPNQRAEPKRADGLTATVTAWEGTVASTPKEDAK